MTFWEAVVVGMAGAFAFLGASWLREMWRAWQWERDNPHYCVNCQRAIRPWQKDVRWARNGYAYEHIECPSPPSEETA